MKRTALAAALAAAISPPLAADSHWSIGTISASIHLDDTYTCAGVEREYNEQHNGLYIKHTWDDTFSFLGGRFDNSYAGCLDFDESYFFGAERKLSNGKYVDWSVVGYVAGGYPRSTSSGSKTIVPRVGVAMDAGPIRVLYGIEVIIFGLEIGI